MIRHHTPLEVATVLARYAPRNLERILDPCTGTGVLIEPLLRREATREVFCIDADPAARKILKNSVKRDTRVRLIKADFLKWAGKAAKQSEQFDCVIMNPPFAARKKDLVRIPRRMPDGRTESICTASEIAFVYQSMALLKERGRLLAILPASAVVGGAGEWLRTEMMRQGAIQLVHELPANTFLGIEAKTYLVVFVKGEPQRQILLRNHRLLNPDQMCIPVELARNAGRLDYAFFEACLLRKTIEEKVNSRWCAVEEVATVWRGAFTSPVNAEKVLHTTNFSTFAPAPPFEGDLNERAVRKGDIILKRVARDCATTFRIYSDECMAPASDCILVIRPNDLTSSEVLLFSLRVVVAWSGGKALLQKGAGASYIRAEDLQKLLIPIDVVWQFSEEFTRYRRALKTKKTEKLDQIEEEIRQQLFNT